MLATVLDWPDLSATLVSKIEDVETLRSTWFLTSHFDFMCIPYVTASARSVFKKIQDYVSACMNARLKDQKGRVSDFLELELQTIMIHPYGCW